MAISEAAEDTGDRRRARPLHEAGKIDGQKSTHADGQGRLISLRI